MGKKLKLMSAIALALIMAVTALIACSREEGEKNDSGTGTGQPGNTDNSDYKDRMKLYYGIDGKDFTGMTDISNLNDADEVLGKMNTDLKKGEVAKYDNDEHGMLIYNPISREARKTGNLKKYASAEKISGSITCAGVTLQYTVPGNITAYDAIPVSYSLKGQNPKGLFYIEATAYGEKERDGDYYDMTLPGTIDAEIRYEGYVAADSVPGTAPVLSAKSDDIQGVSYPSYEASDLVVSGTLPVADYIWLKFSYTNTGNTIWDPEGSGYFCFRPILYRKGENGQWETNDDYQLENFYSRIFDYIYPGEGGEMYVHFRQAGLSAGEYRVVIYGRAYYESATNDWQRNWNGGENIFAGSFEFSVSGNPRITKPNAVTMQSFPGSSRSGWLRTYEEFMTSFEAITETDNCSGTMYVQCAPWTEYITLRVMTGNSNDMQSVRIPVSVETDSVQIRLNTGNNNYIVRKDGTREPMLMAQSMADMRSNTQRGPDTVSTIVNDLLDMKESGINFLSSTMAFTYGIPTSGSNKPMNYESNYFMMDVARSLGFRMECYCAYPYGRVGLYSPNIGSVYPGIDDYADGDIDIANALLANYTFARYADMMYQAGDGSVPIATEDTRGWLRVDMSGVFDISRKTAANYITWLKGRYPTIGSLNAAYGSDYTGFDAIDIFAEASAKNLPSGYTDTMMTFTDGSKTYHDWSKAIVELNIYRTVQRVKNYNRMTWSTKDTKTVRNQTDTVLNPKVIVRTEASPYVSPGIDSDTDNAHYRLVYYSQQRNAVIGEVLAASASVYGHSEYVTIPFSPSEVYELTSRSSEAGLVEYNMPMYSGMNDIVMNEIHGDGKFVADLNLADSSGRTKGAYLRTMVSAFTWMKATYEGGGVPGILWQDYISAGHCTSTQYKEFRFYSGKIAEMLSTPEGKKWAADFTEPDQSWRETVATAWSYPPDYIEKTVDDVSRLCIFDGCYGK